MNTYQTDQAYDGYINNLDTLQLFVFARNSHAGRTSLRGNGWLKQTDSQTPKLMIAMGNMSARCLTLLDVALGVVRSINPHSSRAEWNAKLYDSAMSVLSGKYDDVEKRSGPESYRLSECVRDYNRSEKLIVLAVLQSLCDDYIGVGWAMDRLAKDLGVREIIRSLTGK